MKVDLGQVQRDQVESLQTQRDIVAHIDQLRCKVKRNAHEDENAPDLKRMHDAESEFPDYYGLSVPVVFAPHNTGLAYISITLA